MPTPKQAYAALSPAHSRAVYGQWLFAVGDNDVQPDGGDPVIVFYDRVHCVKYQSLGDARVGANLWLDTYDGMYRDLSDVWGLVFNTSGALTHYISTNGRIWPVRYLGNTNERSLATTPCTRDMLGLRTGTITTIARAFN